MKLSQIRLLSWGVAIIGVLACLFYGFKAYQNIKGASPNIPYEVEFDELTDIPDPRQGQMMTNQRLMQALSFLTKVEPPPPPPPVEVVEKAPPKTVAKIEVPPPPPKKFDPKLQLVLVSYDDIDGNHLAFIKLVGKPSHPYLTGETLPSKPATILKEIRRQSVLVETKDGKQSVEIYTENAIIQKVARSNLEVKAPTKVMVPQKNGGVKAEPAKTRRVPRSRAVSVNKEYGISVVEYDQTPEGELRYAISERDLASLQKQSLRLMSEVFMQPAYDDNGDPKGIQLDFVVDEPLAKAYGIRNGDILTHVDGKQVTNTYEGEQLYNSLSPKKRRVPFTLERNGVPINIWFEMDDFPGTPNRK